MALYRKYRPASFSEVVGQEHVTEPLSIALSSGRINHAYLFSGPRGCGKTSSARILARSLNCVHGPTADPCGECDSCEALAPGGTGTLDVTELDAASHGGVDDTRELRERAFFAPASSRYRVLIIDEAHMVTTAGFNALLKIVEEPPEHLIFVFATTEPDKVLPTIRSRTHHYPFRLLTPSSMRGLVERICDQEGVTVEPTVFPLVIRAGGGSPRDTLSVLDQLMAGAGEEGITYPRAVSLLGATEVALIDDTVDALAVGDGATLFRTVDKVVEAGHDPRRFAADLLQRLRDLIMVQSVPQAIERGLVDAPVEQAGTMRRQSESIGPATLARCADMVHEGMGSMRGATSPRLLLEILCAKLLLPSADDSMAALLQRVESLESGTGTGTGRPAVVGHGGPGEAGPPATAQEPNGEAVSPGVDSAATSTRGETDGRPKFVRRSQRPVESPPDTPAPGPDASASPSAPVHSATSAAEPPAPSSSPPAPAATPERRDSEPLDPAGSEPRDPAGSERAMAPTAASAPTPTAAPQVVGPEEAPEPRADTGADPTSGASEGGDGADPSGERGADTVTDPWRESADDPRAAPVTEIATANPAASKPEPHAEPHAEPQPEPDPVPAAGHITDPEPDQAPVAPAVEAEDMRRAWPAIRDAVRTRTRTVEVMLAGATVAGVDGRVIHLVHDYAPLAKRLSQPHNASVIAESVAQVLGGDWTLRCTSGGAPAAAEASGPPAAAPGGPATPPQAESSGWERRVRGPNQDTPAGSDRRDDGNRAGAGGYDDVPPPPEEPEPEPGDRVAPHHPPVSEDDMMDEARSGPQNIDHRTGEDLALALLKEHLGARPLER